MSRALAMIPAQNLYDDLRRVGPPEAVASAVAAIEAAHEHDWRRHNRGGLTLGDLPRTDRLDLARLVGRVLVKAVGEFLPEAHTAGRIRTALSRLNRGAGRQPRR